MRQYKAFDAADFAADDFFQRWVLTPDPDASHFWEGWLRENPERTETIHKARHLLLALQADAVAVPDAHVQHLWHKIAAQTVARHEPALPAGAALQSRRLSSPFYWLAASLLLLLIGSSLFYWYTAERTARVTYATRFGELKEVRLPDGSVVVLNANSSLSFRDDWQSAGRREVDLTGEAYFTVQKQNLTANGKVRPVKFVVNTPDLRVEVIGTQFNVTNRRNKTAVVLQSGKVRLSLHHAPGQKALDMKPGDLVSYSYRHKSLVQRVVDPGSYNAWKEKRWTLRAASLAEVALRIEETFGLPVDWADDSLKTRTVSGVIPTDRLDIVLQALSVSMNLKITEAQGRISVAEQQ